MSAWGFAFVLFGLLATLSYGYDFDYMAEFLTNRSCWNELLDDVRNPETAFGSCFYQRNFSLSDAEVMAAFTNASLDLPDRIFNPVNYSELLGLSEERYYGEFVFALDKTESGEIATIYGLNQMVANQIVASNDEATRSKYLQFCGARNYLVDVLECLREQLRRGSAEYYADRGCTSVDVETILEGLNTSSFHWNAYRDFCGQIFHCSAAPIAECVTRLNPGVQLAAPINNMESVCLVMARMNQFSPCMGSMTRDCAPVQRQAYADLLSTIQKTHGMFGGGMQHTTHLCDMIKQQCTAPEQWSLMNRLADECFQEMYALEQSLGSRGMEWMSVGVDHMGQQLNNSIFMCTHIRMSQECIRERTGDLPCRASYQTLMAHLMSKLINNCDAYFGGSSTMIVSMSSTGKVVSSVASTPQQSSMQDGRTASADHKCQESTAAGPIKC